MSRDFRDYARDAADTALSFARVTASSILSRAKSLALDLLIAEDDDDSGEEMPGAEVYGEAALLHRPADPDASGAPEAIVWRHGDERIVIATKDRRWQVELEKGDVCLRAFGESAPRLFLRADGTARLEGATIEVEGDTVTVTSDNVRLGSNAAADAVALAPATDARLDALSLALDVFAAAVPIPNDGGAALQAAVKAVWSGPTASANTGATKVTAE